MMMDVQQYLRRISCSGLCARSPTLDTLRALHLQHLLAVPFEDLAIHTGERVRLELPLLYDKIVLKRRGGFCYENNGLFSWLLSQLGFEVEILAAQVKNRFTGAYGPPFDHLIMMVSLDGERWLCDVGYGTGFQRPLSLETDSPQTQSHGVYRVRADGNLFFMETQSESDEWVEMYKFTLQPCQREDFKAMCEYHQSSSSSIFFCKSLCSLLLPNGRITLMGRKLILTHLTSEDGPPVKTTRTDLTDDEIIEILREKFGIVLTSPLIIKDVDIVPPPVNY
ncbi:arylamine N-acetyltransferase, pineal gland isozyme NAT-3-like [Pangasianodon hypophthalmus]|uniref:arylamine N-acetyltransferase, pineal gland isozyme NAT-3-like n=1 Tax=Pangasianodon hypophthalmus TaxID=310915 RepID=UPI000F007C5B|nr:arylamine N-acetyltransferase, pineal gland isozyme NAT-3-like [Pangasianodon hypophthalmus]